jgi:hypothetical protein
LLQVKGSTIPRHSDPNEIDFGDPLDPLVRGSAQVPGHLGRLHDSGIIQGKGREGDRFISAVGEL